MAYISKKIGSNETKLHRVGKTSCYHTSSSEILNELQEAVLKQNDKKSAMDFWKAFYASVASLNNISDHQHHLQYLYPLSADYNCVKDDNCNNLELPSITGIIRTAVKKTGALMQQDKKRVSRQFLMNLKNVQLQVIVDDLQRYIGRLNDELVQLLMQRDELQMSQDATLIDIDDLSLYF
ncbi:uncharacterized protein LOC131432380 [Malaya genurostris]|uniref:uncharacterized protein LOC131432380 n=1 Tax=Malaya genurostris TaxID=325434 RepID=UPI0026F3A298|nr:uncharacterized protein LOC131432380 [Malaya genurostris]XP_058454597.1 uncharacterized protein LOC131432380 [Malaya genurostris]